MYRALLVSVMMFLSVVLLLNPSVQKGCLGKSIRQFDMPGGVLPYNETVLYDTMTVENLRASVMQQIVNVIPKQRTFLPVSHAECPDINNGLCSSYYLIQTVPQGDPNINWTNQDNGLLRYATTPIYQVFTDIYNWSLPVENNGAPADYCREYGVPGIMSIRICAIDVFDTQWNESSVVLREFLHQVIV
jgi:hypothetical protein